MKRPPPEGFAEAAAVTGYRGLREQFRASTADIQRWTAETGVCRPAMKGGRPRREKPADFDRLRQTMTYDQLITHYRVGQTTVHRWVQESGGRKLVLDSIPDDFAERWKTTSIRDLALHYGRGAATASAWAKKLGLHRPQGIQLVKRAAKSKPPRKRRAAETTPPTLRLIKPNAFQTAPLDRVQRDMSAAGQAADYLRKFGPVYRCDVKGSPIADGFFWRRGSAVLTDAELIERAEWMRSKAA